MGFVEMCVFSKSGFFQKDGFFQKEGFCIKQIVI